MRAAVGIRRCPDLHRVGSSIVSAAARSSRQIRFLQRARPLSTLPCSSPSVSSAHRRRFCPRCVNSTSSGSGAVFFPSGVRQTVRSFATAHVDELRTGNIIEHEGRLCKVVAHEAHMRGRSHTTITVRPQQQTLQHSRAQQQCRAVTTLTARLSHCLLTLLACVVIHYVRCCQLELRDLSTGKNSTVRLRPSDKVDQVTLESENLTFLYRDSQSLHLMHPDSFETVELPLSAISSHHLPFLADNSPVRATKRGSAYLDISLPDRVRGKVTLTEGVKGGGKSGVNDAGVRRALLENGEWIDNVPNNVEAGDVILINTVTMAFVQRE